MKKQKLIDIKIKLPENLKDDFDSNEIINLLINKALAKVEYYNSKILEMAGKYGINYNGLKKKLKKSQKENFTEWDDLLLWEGYNLAHKEWKKKFEDLKNCMK